mmetsp:Transcript_62617/g.201928  ORF Transcript_62617/g.201928 Transcript_62617/m.201928 type:complete len:335 (+) Transcript_62617:512-1516(+)
MVAIHPLGEGHPLFVHRAVGMGSVAEAVHEVAPHEDLQQVAGLPSLARPAPELRHVQAVPLGERDDLLCEVADLGLRHVEGLQEAAQDLAEGYVLAAVAGVEDLGHAGLGARADEGAHRGDAHPAEGWVVVPLVVRELRVESAEQGMCVGNVVEVLHKDPRQRSRVRPEAEQHAGHRSLHLIEQRREGVGVVEDSPGAAVLLFACSQLLEARLGVRVVREVFQARALGRTGPQALRAVSPLQLHLAFVRPAARERLRAVPLGVRHGVGLAVVRVQHPEPARLPRLLVRLRRAVCVCEVDRIRSAAGMKLEDGVAHRQVLADLLGLLSRDVAPTI